MKDKIVKNYDEYDYCPSAEEIKQKCEEIRSKWSENERHKRAGFPVPKNDNS